MESALDRQARFELILGILIHSNFKEASPVPVEGVDIELGVTQSGQRINTGYASVKGWVFDHGEIFHWELYFEEMIAMPSIRLHTDDPAPRLIAIVELMAAILGLERRSETTKHENYRLTMEWR